MIQKEIDIIQKIDEIKKKIFKLVSLRNILGQVLWEINFKREICMFLNDGSKGVWKVGLGRRRS